MTGQTQQQPEKPSDVRAELEAITAATVGSVPLACRLEAAEIARRITKRRRGAGQ